MVHVLVTGPMAYYTALVDRNKTDRTKFAFGNNPAVYRTKISKIGMKIAFLGILSRFHSFYELSS